MADILIQTDAIVPSAGTLQLRVEESINDTGAVDNSATVSIADGSTESTVSGFDAQSGNAYRIIPDLSTSDETVTAELTDARVVELFPVRNVAQSVNGDDDITITWTDESDDADLQRIQVREDGGTWTDVTTVSPGVESVSYAADPAVNEHTFRVRAELTDGTATAWTATATVATDPTSLTETTASGSQVDLSWTGARDANDYVVYRAEASGSTTADYTQVATVGATSYSDTGRENGERYYYRVQAVYGGTDSQLSNEADTTTALSAPTIDSLDDSVEDAITVAYSLADNSTDGDVLVERSTDGGSTWATVATVTDLQQTSVTDTGRDDGTQYTYRVTRRTDHVESASGTATATTVAPAPTLDGITVSGDVLTVDGTDTGDAELRHEIEVQRTNTTGSSWSQSGSDIAAVSGDGNAISGDTAALLDGEQYDVRLRTVYPDATAVSSSSTATTDLSDEDQPVLGNGVEDEIAVDRESQLSDYGNVRIQTRETGETAWDSSAVGWDEQVLDHATLTTTVTGREDGEEYEVRARTETEHVTGSWTAPVSIKTKFPGATGLSLTVQGPKQIDGTFTDNSDNEDGFRVQRRDELDPARPTGFSSWTTVQTLDPNETSFTDTSLEPNHDYEYRIEAFTEHSSATTPSESATTDVAYGPYWTLELRRADGEVLTIDGEHFLPPSPTMSRAPSRITPWSVEIPETRALTEFDWLNSDAFLWFGNGSELVLRGELHKADHPNKVAPEEGQRGITRLEGADVGFEFKHGGAHERYQAIKAYKAVEDYLTTHFPGWTTTVYRPSVQLIDSDKLVQSADSTSEWQSIYSPPSDVPVEISNGTLTLTDAAYSKDVLTDRTGSGGSFGNVNDNAYNDGVAAFIGASGAYIELEFTPQHDIPASEVGIQIRDETIDSTQNAAVSYYWDGTEFDNNTGLFFGLGWRDIGSGYYGGPGYESAIGQDLQAGQTYTLRIEAGNDKDYNADVVAVYDKRYSFSFPNPDAATNAGGYLSGPEPKPDAVDVEFASVDETRNVPSASVSLTIDDTSNNQAIAASNNGGTSYSLTAANSATLSGSFPNPGSLPRVTLTLSRYGSGRDEFPTSGYNGQSVDNYELRVDTNSLAVIDDRTVTGDHLGNIQSLVDDAGMIWVTPYSESGKVIEVFKPGEVTATLPDVEILDGTETHDKEQYYNAITVFGGDSGDGTPLEATAESQTEISSYGRREGPAAFEPRLESQADVENQANQLLATGIANRSAAAALDIVPKTVTPGYEYDVPGVDEDLVLREVRFEDGQRGQLRFTDDEDIVSVLAGLSREVKQTKDAF